MCWALPPALPGRWAGVLDQPWVLRSARALLVSFTLVPPCPVMGMLDTQGNV